MWSGSQRKNHGKASKTQSQGKAFHFPPCNLVPRVMSPASFSRQEREPWERDCLPMTPCAATTAKYPKKRLGARRRWVCVSLCRINLGQFAWYNMSNLGTCLSSACFIKFRADGIFKHALVLNIKGYMRAQRFFLKEATIIIQFQC